MSDIGETQGVSVREVERDIAAAVRIEAAAPASLVAAAPANSPAQAPREGEVLAPRKRSPKRFVLALALLAALGFGGVKGYHWFTIGRFIVSTDDAYVKADTATLSARVSGYVKSVAVAGNQRVEAGDVLVVIDDGDYRLAVASARQKIATQDASIGRIGEQVRAQAAAVEQARAQLDAAEAEARRAEAAFRRADTLAKSDFASKATLEAARADRDRSAAAVAQAKSAIAAAEGAIAVLEAQKGEASAQRAELRTGLDKAERDLSFTTIVAPFSGVIGNRAAQPGQYVQPGARLMALVPLDSVYVEANLKETQLAGIRPGQKVDVEVDALNGRVIEGVVESVAPASGAQFSLLPPENATGNFTKIVQRVPVRVRLSREAVEQANLRPGLSVVVGVHTRDESAPKPSLLSALGLSAIAEVFSGNPRR